MLGFCSFLNDIFSLDFSIRGDTVRILYLGSSNKKKVRGLKRKIKSMVENMYEYTEEFPEEHYEGAGYWHMHLPVAQDLIDSSNTPQSVRKLCVQTLIDRVEHLVKAKPKTEESSRVVGSIDLPNLWDSQITVFFDQSYFEEFFDRDSDEQRWIPLPPNRNIAREWGLEVPSDLKIKGYKEEIHDEDYDHVGEIWFIGELD